MKAATATYLKKYMLPQVKKRRSKTLKKKNTKYGYKVIAIRKITTNNIYL